MNIKMLLAPQLPVAQVYGRRRQRDDDDGAGAGRGGTHLRLPPGTYVTQWVAMHVAAAHVPRLPHRGLWSAGHQGILVAVEMSRPALRVLYAYAHVRTSRRALERASRPLAWFLPSCQCRRGVGAGAAQLHTT